MRWDGGHKRDRFLTDVLEPYVEWVPVCPEVEIGMGTPREPVRLVRQGDEIAMLGTKSGRDWTAPMRAWSEKRARQLTRLDLCGYVLKKDSPSCGMERVKVRSEKGMPKKEGQGLFAKELMRHNPTLPVEEEGRLHDAVLRENFVERIFAYRRLRSFFEGSWSVGRLVAFHTAHKLQLMAHSPQAYRSLGRLVADAKRTPRGELRARYESEFMGALAQRATRRRHVNVLQHCIGHFRKRLEAEARAELAGTDRGLSDGAGPSRGSRHHDRPLRPAPADRVPGRPGLSRAASEGADAAQPCLRSASEPPPSARFCHSSASAAPAFPDAIARGDAAYLRRAEGGSDGLAASEPIGEAIRAYQEAVATDPPDLEARWKLLRALHFEGDFVADQRDTKRRVFDRGRILSDEGVTLLAERVGGGKQLHEISSEELQERLEQAAAIPHDIAAFYFWSAINWAAWSQVAGLLSAVRRGVANRLRDYTLVVLTLEPKYEEGGAQRLMAALHARLPRVPFLSGWVDRSEALPYVERALAIAPEHPGNQLLLALTLLDLHPERRDEALAELERVSALQPRPASEVEDLAVQREARERLEEELASDGELQ